MWRQEHLSKVPDLCVFITSHISLTPYSFEFHKGSDISCCGFKHTLSRFQVLAMQRQPTPRLVQKLNWRWWPNSFVVAIFSLVTAIYWERYCFKSDWHKKWSYRGFISIKNITLCEFYILMAPLGNTGNPLATWVVKPGPVCFHDVTRFSNPVQYLGCHLSPRWRRGKCILEGPGLLPHIV